MPSPLGVEDVEAGVPCAIMPSVTRIRVDANTKMLTSLLFMTTSGTFSVCGAYRES
jgi:hypothetical protein